MRSRCRCSMCPAIHINSRSWLRSSSTHEPSDPPLRVISFLAPSRAGSLIGLGSIGRPATNETDRSRHRLTRNGRRRIRSHPGQIEPSTFYKRKTQRENRTGRKRMCGGGVAGSSLFKPSLYQSSRRTCPAEACGPTSDLGTPDQRPWIYTGL